jgi:hypothetical protein
VGVLVDVGVGVGDGVGVHVEVAVGEGVCVGVAVGGTSGSRTTHETMSDNPSITPSHIEPNTTLRIPHLRPRSPPATTLPFYHTRSDRSQLTVATPPFPPSGTEMPHLAHPFRHEQRHVAPSGLPGHTS